MLKIELRKLFGYLSERGTSKPKPEISISAKSLQTNSEALKLAAKTARKSCYHKFRASDYNADAIRLADSNRHQPT